MFEGICYHGNKSTIFLFYSIFRTTPEVLSKLYFVEYVKSQRSYGFLITKELIFGFQILDLKDHFSASLSIKQSCFFFSFRSFDLNSPVCSVNMRAKATKSGEQVVIFNVYKYFKVHNPSESQNFLFKCTSEATGSSISAVRRIVKQSDGPERQVKKKKK